MDLLIRALSWLCWVGLASAAWAADYRPALVFDTAAVESSGFNREALDGAIKFQRLHELHVANHFLPGKTRGESELAALIETALSQGANHVIAIGFPFESPIAVAARRHPKVHFTLIDGTSDPARIQNIVFREEEGAFLMGALAAMASTRGRIGFVGGMDIPLIRRFACGYAQGARHVAPGIETLWAMNGATLEAFFDAAKAAKLATMQIERGADVVFHAAGAAGLGVIETAAARGVKAIGVDSNQNGLAPGHVLSSMLKRMDVAVYLALREGRDGLWQPGVRQLGLRETGIDWALDRHNVGLIEHAWHERLVDLHFAIRAEQIRVFRYTGATPCPHLDLTQPTQ